MPRLLPGYVGLGLLNLAAGVLIAAHLTVIAWLLGSLVALRVGPVAWRARRRTRAWQAAHREARCRAHFVAMTRPGPRRLIELRSPRGRLARLRELASRTQIW